MLAKLLTKSSPSCLCKLNFLETQPSLVINILCVCFRAPVAQLSDCNERSHGLQIKIHEARFLNFLRRFSAQSSEETEHPWDKNINRTASQFTGKRLQRGPASPTVDANG